MSRSTRATTAILAISALSSLPQNDAFSFVPTRPAHRRSCGTSSQGRRTTSSLQMGLFDGVKEAFSAPPTSSLDAERETPIDRWMGWNAKKEEEETPSGSGSKSPANFIDAMDEANYATASLSKPMGIVFEENDSDVGGIFILSISEDGNAAAEGTLKPGDQLVAVGDKKVAGQVFDEALGTIVDDDAERTKLICFRGPAKQLYGPAGASQAWLDEFISSQN